MDGLVVKAELRLGGQFKHKLGSKGIDIQLFMRGMWRNAFGSDWFAIGNINVGLVYQVLLDNLIELSAIWRKVLRRAWPILTALATVRNYGNLLCFGDKRMVCVSAAKSPLRITIIFDTSALFKSCMILASLGKCSRWSF